MPRQREPAPAASSSGSAESAKAAGLRYVADTAPGIRRRRSGTGWTYVMPDDSPVDSETRSRIKALAIPPAWTEVWISKAPNGHIQATGRDARGRKQYRYHERWHEVRDEAKYGRLSGFARQLPRIREQVDADLALAGLPRRKLLAAVVRLLESTLIRIGNEQYARENESFGLSTLRSEHADVTGSTITFKFRGKSGIDHEISIRDRKLASVVRRTQDLPGEELFQYIDDSGEPQSIGSSDVNDYLREVTGEDYTAKDFRTWFGTVLAAMALSRIDGFSSASESRHNIKSAIEQVAKSLGNTVTICRKCYVHPAVIESYLSGTIEKYTRQASRRSRLKGLAPEEWATLMLLETEAG